MATKTNNLDKIAFNIRRAIVEMARQSKAPDAGSALCIADILAVLYFKILKINPQKPKAPERDRFILSKGHGAAALYAALAERGFFPASHLKKYRTNGGIFHGHPSFGASPGIEVSTGSLGHGLSIGAGMAWELKKSRPNVKVYVLLGDGECNEGSVWEAAMFAATHRLGNLIAIIDKNKFQGFGETRRVHDMDFAKIWSAFGWKVFSCDGHNLKDLEMKLKRARQSQKPSVVIADTVAGKGIPAIENSLVAHYYIPKKEDYIL
jgi:transketolase